ncbi:MAG: lipocalin family protein [Janthinobacterium lividum]
MKKIKQSLVAITVLGFMLVACKQNGTKQLAKTWQVSDIKTAERLPDSLKAKMLSGSQVIFTEDGHYNMAGGIGVDQGTYTLDKDNKNLSTISAAGKTNQVYTIDNLSDTELVLKNSGNTMTFTTTTK